MSAVEPRVCRYPPYRYSHAEDAIDLASMAGFSAYTWQRTLLGPALGEREDGKWSAFEVGLVVGRQQGKGGALEVRALGGLFLFDEELILWSAHEYRTAMEMFRRVRACIRRMGRRVNDNLYDVGGVRIKVVNTNGEEGFERLDTGQRIQFIARSKNAGRGFTADCLIWDEAYALTEGQVDAQMPTLLARHNAQIWYTSSPPLDAISGAQLFRLRRRAASEGESRLAYFEWSVDGCLDDLSSVDLDDRALWAQALPAYGDGVTDESVQQLRDGMSDVGFAREILCIWPPDMSDGFQVIPEADWAAAHDLTSTPTDPVAFCVDTVPDRAWTSIAVAGRRADGLLHGEVVDHRQGTSWVVTRLADLVGRWKPCRVVIDAAGPAGSLIADVEAAGIEVTKPTARDMAQACGMLYDRVCGPVVEARTFRYRGDPEFTAKLTLAVAGAAKRNLADAWAWDRRSTDVVISPLVAVTGAIWGLLTAPLPEPDQPFFAAWR